MRWLFALLLLSGFATAARAGEVAASPPSDVSVTIYRDPGRNGGAIQLGTLGGFAVITETRRVTIPAGRSTLRFIGVVDGIIPASAIVSGLPGGVIEKNRDAALLSPASLMRAARGKVITLKRTNRDTGKVERIAGQIVSASDQGVVFRTAAGTEALHCSGLAETFSYGRDAQGLSAQPVLSVQTRAAKPITAQVTLTYIAEQFDWSANYTAQLAPDGKSVDLGGWITLANGNSVSLSNARTQIVAGGLNREYVGRYVNNQPLVIARCWPIERTSDVPLKPGRPYALVNPYLPRAAVYTSESDSIVVTAQRRQPEMMMSAPAPVSVVSEQSITPEQLGDLKLYTVPQRTTVAALQMKQTRLIERRGVPVERIYRASMQAPTSGSDDPLEVHALLRTINDQAHQLGLPLPAGAFLIAQDQFGRTMIVGEPALRDTAADEKVELALGQAPDVSAERRATARGDKARDVEVTISNAGASDIAFELDVNVYPGQRIVKSDLPSRQRNGRPVFAFNVPHNAAVTLHLSVTDD